MKYGEKPTSTTKPLPKPPMKPTTSLPKPSAVSGMCPTCGKAMKNCNC